MDDIIHLRKIILWSAARDVCFGTAYRHIAPSYLLPRLISSAYPNAAEKRERIRIPRHSILLLPNLKHD
jgi:hypothetical protein